MFLFFHLLKIYHGIITLYRKLLLFMYLLVLKADMFSVYIQITFTIYDKTHLIIGYSQNWKKSHF